MKQEINALIKSKVAQACTTTIGPLLEHDTLPSVAQLAVRVASKKAAVFCKQWERKSVYKGYQETHVITILLYLDIGKTTFSRMDFLCTENLDIKTTAQTNEIQRYCSLDSLLR